MPWLCAIIHVEETAVEVLTDALLAAGALAVDVQELGCDFYAITDISFMDQVVPGRSSSTGTAWPRCGLSWVAAI